MLKKIAGTIVILAIIYFTYLAFTVNTLFLLPVLSFITPAKHLLGI